MILNGDEERIEICKCQIGLVGMAQKKGRNFWRVTERNRTLVIERNFWWVIERNRIALALPRQTADWESPDEDHIS